MTLSYPIFAGEAARVIIIRHGPTVVCIHCWHPALCLPQARHPTAYLCPRAYHRDFDVISTPASMTAPTDTAASSQNPLHTMYIRNPRRSTTYRPRTTNDGQTAPDKKDRRGAHRREHVRPPRNPSRGRRAFALPCSPVALVAKHPLHERMRQDGVLPRHRPVQRPPRAGGLDGVVQGVEVVAHAHAVVRQHLRVRRSGCGVRVRVVLVL